MKGGVLSSTRMLAVTERGLYCGAGDFYIDPWGPVKRALITHAHGDHARPGTATYLCAAQSIGVLRARLGAEASITGLAYGERRELNGVRVSFHPAGHILGSAQIRLEQRGEIWVVSGDYKTRTDPTCAGFEPIRCHTFLTESTFALPIYRWPDPGAVVQQLHEWWHTNQEEGRTSVLFAYSLGKAQRILASLDSSIGPIAAHPAVRELLPHYEAAGCRLPKVEPLIWENLRASRGRTLVIAPPSSAAPGWLKNLGDVSTAFVSGWMLLRGTRRRQALERGFPISDHADWDELLQVVRATEAQRVLVTHGYSETLVRWLRETGCAAEVLRTQFEGETTSELVRPEAPVTES